MTRSRIRARFEAWLPLSVTGRGMEAADIRDRGPFGLKLYLSVRTVVLHYLIRKLNVAGVAASVPLSLTGATSDAVDWLMLAPLFANSFGGSLCAVRADNPGWSPPSDRVRHGVLSFAIVRIIGTILFTVCCVALIAGGALQCFAPQRLRQLQKQLRPKADWSASAGGKFFEDLADNQAANPSLGYRLGGLFVMAMGLYMLSSVIARLLR